MLHYGIIFVLHSGLVLAQAVNMKYPYSALCVSLKPQEQCAAHLHSAV